MIDPYVATRRVSRAAALLGCLLVVSAAAPAAGAPVIGTLLFEVDWVDIPNGRLQVQPVLGMPVEISLGYELSSAPSTGTFSADLASLSIRIGDQDLLGSNPRLTLARFVATDSLLIRAGLSTPAGTSRGNLNVDLELADGFDGQILTSRLPTLDELLVEPGGIETRSVRISYWEEELTQPGYELESVLFTARLVSLTTVPEPSTGVLLGVGLGWLGARARSRGSA